MLPRLQIRVNLNTDGNDKNPDPSIGGLITTALTSNPAWDCRAISSYAVKDVTTNKQVKIQKVYLSGDTADTTQQCKPAPPGTMFTSYPAVLLVLHDHQVAKNDELTVSLANLPARVAVSSSAQVSPSDKAIASLWTSTALTITPQAAPSETLTTGAKRDTGQLAIAFTDPEIAPDFHVAALSASTTDLFSTDERDAKSAFAATLGLTRGLPGGLYLPGSIKQTVQGNQVATSLSLATAASVGSLAPAPWTNWALYNKVLQSPSPIEWTVSAAYTHRIRQVVSKGGSLLTDDDFSLNPSATLTPIYVLPKVCSAYQKWLTPKKSPSAGGGDAAATGGASQSSSSSKQYCLGLQTDIGLWYLPMDKTKGGLQKAEGYGDISFLVPLTDIPFAASTITNLITGSTTSAQLHIKYADDVNAANNYVRTKQWTFAFEVIK
jgi:hypothetical protein